MGYWILTRILPALFALAYLASAAWVAWSL